MLLGLSLAAIVVLFTTTKEAGRLGVAMWMLALYSMSVPFASALRTGLPPPVESLSSVLGTLSLVVLAHRLFSTGRIRPILDIQVPLWLLVAGLVMVSALRTANGVRAWEEVLALTGLAGLYLLATLIGTTRLDLLLIQRATSLGGSVLGIFALFQLVTGTLPAGQSGVRRFEVPWAGGDPNITAASLVLPLALAAYLQRGETSAVNRAVALGSLVLSFGAIALTGSRAGLIVAAVVVVHHLWTMRRVGLTLGLLTAAGIPAYIAWDSIGTQVGRLDSTGRTGVWTVAWSKCAEWCSHGAGLGSFPDVHRTGAIEGAGPLPSKYRFEAHSSFLQVLIESGAVALTVLIIACAATVWSLNRYGMAARSAYVLAFGGLLTTNAFLSNFSFKYFWLVLMHTAWAVSIDRAWLEYPEPSRRLEPVP